jgi:SAM-dependent methyltransferase
MRECWCGDPAPLQPFGPDYGHCRACGTLVCLKGLSDEALRVRDDETDFYGKKYWLSYQDEAFGYPGFHARARADLPERDLFWLKALLKYCLPPADVLELGCAHGGFVALLQLAGFHASGSEMSPWVVEYARRTFGISVSVGTMESLGLPEASLDVIALMDVIEHIPDPVAAMRHGLERLRAPGIFVIQTPHFVEERSYDSLIQSGDPFLAQLKPEEHLYLFSQRAAREFFARLGAPYVSFEPAIFAHYDMFLVASRAPLVPREPDAAAKALMATPGGRMALALLDLEERRAAEVKARDEDLDGTRRMVRLTEENRDYWRAQAELQQREHESWKSQAERYQEEVRCWLDEAQQARKERDATRALAQQREAELARLKSRWWYRLGAKLGLQ